MAGYRLSGEGYTDEEMRVLKRMCKSGGKTGFAGMCGG